SMLLPCKNLHVLLLLIASLAGCTITKSAISESLPFESPEEPAGRTPLKAFASLPLIQTMALSPSGTYLASTQNVGTKTYLVTTPHDGKDMHRILVCDNSTYLMRWFKWVNDERLLIGVYVADVNTDGMYDFKWVQTRLLAINRDGSNLKADLIGPNVSQI